MLNQVQYDGKLISGAANHSDVGNGLLCSFGGKDVFESCGGFGEGDTQRLSDKFGRERVLVAVAPVLIHQFRHQNSLIIYGVALGLFGDVFTPLGDGQERYKLPGAFEKSFYCHKIINLNVGKYASGSRFERFRVKPGMTGGHFIAALMLSTMYFTSSSLTYGPAGRHIPTLKSNSLTPLT